MLFTFTPAQRILLQKCRDQMNKYNQIRLVIIKGRQQGISTFCRAMINWRMSYFPQTVGLIVAQREKDLREKAFRGLIDMYEMQVQKMPIDRGNTTKLKVNHGAKAGYSVCFGEWAAAGGQSRGDRYNIIHLTEVDYYPDWTKFWGGLSQSIPNGNQSIVLIESTSGGRRALWDMYQQSLSPDSPFDYVFLPWYIQPEYRTEITGEFTPTDREIELKRQFGLVDEQLLWYRIKRQELGSDIALAREYPNTPEEAFSVSSNLSFFDYVHIENAINSQNVEDHNATLIMGIDPSRNRDSTGICFRRGRTITKILELDPYMDTVRLSKDLYKMITHERPTHTFIDVGGLGYGVYDMLNAMGVTGLTPVHFGEQADDNRVYLNKRAEMYGRFKKWLSEPPCSIPNNQEFLNQILMIEQEDRLGKIQLTAKNKMPKSPDLADAAVLTFAGYDEDYINKDSFSDVSNFNISTDWNPFSI